MSNINGKIAKGAGFGVASCKRRRHPLFAKGAETAVAKGACFVVASCDRRRHPPFAKGAGIAVAEIARQTPRLLIPPDPAVAKGAGREIPPPAC